MESCESDEMCRNGDLCDGLESCEQGRCVASTTPLTCEHLAPSSCEAGCAPDEACEDSRCVSLCLPPAFPTLGTLPVGFSWQIPEGVLATIDGQPLTESWLNFPEAGQHTLSLTWAEKPNCLETTLNLKVDSPAALRQHHAIAAADTRIQQWGAEVVDYQPGEAVVAPWSDRWRALGEASTTSTTAGLSLGEGGSATLAFEFPFSDRPGFDFAVFENAFSELFLELAWVEVSSNGQDFVRFDALSEQSDTVAAYGTLNPDELHGLAGLHTLGQGTAYDLAALQHHPLVLTGRVDLSAIRYVRIVDLKGDGEARDALGHPIWDPWPTRDSAGFDLNGIAAF